MGEKYLSGVTLTIYDARVGRKRWHPRFSRQRDGHLGVVFTTWNRIRLILRRCYGIEVLDLIKILRAFYQTLPLVTVVQSRCQFILFNKGGELLHSIFESLEGLVKYLWRQSLCDVVI